MCTGPMGDVVLGKGFPVNTAPLDGLMVTLHNAPVTTAELEAMHKVDYVATKAEFPSLANMLLQDLGHRKLYVEFILTANEKGTAMPDKSPMCIASD